MQHTCALACWRPLCGPSSAELVTKAFFLPVVETHGRSFDVLALGTFPYAGTQRSPKIVLT